MNFFFAQHEFPRPFLPFESGKDWLPRQGNWEKEIKEMVGAKSEDHFLLTEDRSSANFCALFSTYTDCIRETGRTHLLFPFGEHPSITEGVKRLEKFEVEGKELPLNEQGQLTKRILDEHIRARSAMLSISWAHDLTGVVQPIDELFEICHARGVKLHVDMTHAIGKLFFSGGFDILTFDGAFLGAPRGTGALISREKVVDIAFGKAPAPPNCTNALLNGVALALDQIDQMALEVARLRDLFETKLKEAYPSCELFFTDVERLPSVAVVAFPGIQRELLHLALQRTGVWATEGQGRLAEILKACGVDPLVAHSALSFSFSTLTTQQEIEKGAELIAETAKTLLPIGEGVLC